jgi:hypothetical protein
MLYDVGDFLLLCLAGVGSSRGGPTGSGKMNGTIGPEVLERVVGRRL